MLIAFRLVQGAACGVGFVVARAIVRDIYGGHEAARIFALLVLISGVAPVLAPVLGGQVLLLTSWRGIFVVLVAFSASMLASPRCACARRCPRTCATSRASPPRSRSSATCSAIAASSPTPPPAASRSPRCSPTSAARRSCSRTSIGLSPQLYGVVFGVNAAGIVICSQVSRRLVERLGPRALLTAGNLAMALGCVVLALAVLLGAGLAAILVALVLTISSIGLILPNSTALAMAHQQHAAGSASALFGLGQFGVGALAAPLVGIAGSHDALPMAIVIAVCGLGSLAIERLGPARGA